MALLRLFQFGIVFTIGFQDGLASLFARAIGVSDTPLSIRLYDPPESVIAVKGRSVSLPCNVDYSSSGKPPHEIIWYQNNREIIRNDTTNRRCNVNDDGSLYIPKVAPSDKGQYRCLVRNRVGALLSNPATVRLASMDREFFRDPANVSVPERHSVVLFCTINSTPGAKITWELNNSPLPQNTRYVPLLKGALFITETHSSDAGSFRCKATNSLLKKTKTSKIGRLTILTDNNGQQSKAPSFLPLDDDNSDDFITSSSSITTANVNADIGSDLTLYCIATGWPIPTVRWIRNNTVIGNSSILHITNVTTATATGSYRCRAENHLATIEQEYFIQVQQKPYFNITPTSKHYLNGVTVRLECQALGVPSPEIHWLKDGKEMELGLRVRKQHHKLVFSHTFSYDSGMYQCVAENSAGRIWAGAQLELAGNGSILIPRPPENVRCRSYDHKSICLEWQPPSNVSVQAYTIYSFLKTNNLEKLGPDYVTNMTHHLATGLDSNKNYTFYVRLFSNVASDQSENITCITGVQGNRNLHITSLNTSAVRLSWSELSTDKPCDVTKPYYELQWRIRDRSVYKVDHTQRFVHVIAGLSSSSEYEFRVISTAYKNSNDPWLVFNPSVGGAAVAPVPETEVEMVPVPDTLYVDVKSPTQAALSWTDVNDDNKHDYLVCYGKIDDDVEDDVGDETARDCHLSVKSPTNHIEIDGLQPDTLYRFKVATRYINGFRSTYSHPVDVRTRKNVPSPVTDLIYKLVNDTTACLRWKPLPASQTMRVTEYLVTYSPDPNRPLEKWSTKRVPAFEKNLDCTIQTNGSFVSTSLTDLTSDKDYMVYIQAVSSTGPGNPTKPIIIKTMSNLTSDVHVPTIKEEQNNRENDTDNTKLGTVIGLVVAIVGIIMCLGCLVARRRYVKNSGRPITGSSGATSATGHPVAHYATDTSRVQVRVDNNITPRGMTSPHSATVVLDRQEVERLVGHDCNNDESTTIVSALLGTEDKHHNLLPNGHVNGTAAPHANGGITMATIDNGHVHITENPRYVKFERQNGHRKQAYEEDTNSNLKIPIAVNRKLKHRFFHRPTTNHNDSFDGHPNDRLNTTELTCLDLSLD